MFGKRNILSLVAAISVLVLALGCQQAAAPQPTPKPAEKGAVATATKAADKAGEKPVRVGTLRYVASSNPDTLDPHAGPGGALARAVIEALIQTMAIEEWYTYVLTPEGESKFRILTYSTASGAYEVGISYRENFHSQGTRNYYGPYNNPQVDQLLEKAGSIYDQKERTALYQQVAKIIADDMPFIPTYVLNNINGLSQKLRNFVQYPDNYPRLHQVWLAQ